MRFRKWLLSRTLWIYDQRYSHPELQYSVFVGRMKRERDEASMENGSSWPQLCYSVFNVSSSLCSRILNDEDWVPAIFLFVLIWLTCTLRRRATWLMLLRLIKHGVRACLSLREWKNIGAFSFPINFALAFLRYIRRLYFRLDAAPRTESKTRENLVNDTWRTKGSKEPPHFRGWLVKRRASACRRDIPGSLWHLLAGIENLKFFLKKYYKKFPTFRLLIFFQFHAFVNDTTKYYKLSIN